MPNEARQVAEECGNLPLALAMTGAMASEIGWIEVLKCLQQANLDGIESDYLKYDYPNLARALQASLDNLEDAERMATLQARKRYLELAVFPEDTAIPISTLNMIWGWGADRITEFDAIKLTNGLVKRALLQRDIEGKVRLHDLQRDFIVNMAKREKPLAERQAAFLEAYRSKTNEGLWHTLPDDGYIYQHLAWHMVQAGQYVDLERLLLDFDWLQVKLARTDINDLLRDYDVALGSTENLSQAISYALSMIQETLRRSAHALAQEKNQLPGQLLGRMMDLPRLEIKNMLEKARSCKERPWLRPLIGSLIPPGDPFLHLLSGHKGTVRSMAITPDGHWGATAGNSSPDQTVRVWDLFTGFELRTLAGEADPGGYDLLGLTPDG